MSIKHLIIVCFTFIAYLLPAQESDNIRLTILNKDSEFSVKNLDINTESLDFGTSFFKDKIVFTSAGRNSDFVKIVSNNNVPFTDLYIAEIHGDDLINVRSFDKKINKNLNEGPASFNKSGTFTAFSRNNYDEKISKGKQRKIQIFTAEYKNNDWVNIVSLDFNSPEYSVGHPALTADGNTMYFASDMPGGFGKTDIYVTYRDKNGEWSKPENLGAKINTKDHDMYPFIYGNDVLFFASEGHSGKGGLDIFLSVKKNGAFSKPENIGSPFNSEDDDFAFILDDSAEKGYFSSNRKGGKGSDDIYSFSLLKQIITQKALNGKVLDIEKNTIPKITVVLFDNKGNKLKSVLTDNNGEFSFNLEPNNIYKIECTNESYDSKRIQVDTHTEDALITKEIILELKPEKFIDYELLCNIIDIKTKKPVQDVRLTVKDNLNNIQDTLFTDEKGSLKIKNNKIQLNDSVNYTLLFESLAYEDVSRNYKAIVKEAKGGTLLIEMSKIEINTDTNIVTEKEPDDIILTGKLTDDKYNSIPNIDLVLKDNKGNKIESVSTNENGEFNFNIQPHTFYKIECDQEKYKPISVIVNPETGDSVIVKDIIMELIAEPVINPQLICNVRDSQTKEPLSDTKITVFDKTGDKKDIYYTDENGTVMIKGKDAKLNDSLHYSFNFKNSAYKETNRDLNEIIRNTEPIILNIEMIKTEIIKDTNIIANTDPVFNPELRCNVRDSKTNEPLSNTKITVYDKSTDKKDIYFTDENGSVIIKGNDVKLNDSLHYSFNFKNLAYEETNKDLNEIIRNSDPFSLDIEMKKIEIIKDTNVIADTEPVEVLLTGKLTDTKYNSIPFMDLVLTDNKGNRIESVSTDENGEFNFNIKPHTFYKIECDQDKYKPISVIVNPETGDSVIVKDIIMDLVAEPIFDLNFICHVKDKNSKDPLSNTKVTVFDKIKNKEKTYYTDEKGTFIIENNNVKLNDSLYYSLHFKNLAYEEVNTDYMNVIQNGEPHTLDIEMNKIDITDTNFIAETEPVEVILKGKITDTEKNALSNIDLVLVDSKGNRIGTVNTDENGEFDFNIQPHTFYKIECDQDKFKPVSVRIDPETGDSVIVKEFIMEVVPEALYDVEFVCGTIDKDTRSPLSKVKVTVIDKTTNNEKTLYTNESGSFTLLTQDAKSDDPLSYNFVFEKKGYKKINKEYNAKVAEGKTYFLEVEMTKEEIIPDTNVVVQIEPEEVSLKGKVKDMNGNGISNTEILLFDNEGNKFASNESDYSGEYSFTVNPNTTYKIEFRKENYKSISLSVNTNTEDSEIIKDIILEKIPEPVFNFDFICTVIDKESKKPASDINVTVSDKINNTKKLYKTDESGKIIINHSKRKLNDLIKYSLTFENDKYFKQTAEYYETVTKGKEYSLIIELQKIDISVDLGDLSEIYPIYFDYNKFNIRSDAAKELDKIVKILNDHPTVEIELSSHTDCRGAASYNLDLSNKRAKASADYIKKRVTNPSRISAKGYGETKLVNNCDCSEKSDVKCSEADHQKNRRTEFKIIKK